MSSFVHEAANGTEWEFYLNEASGVVTMAVLEEDQPSKPFPISTYNGSLPYPALKSGFNTQTVTLVKLEIFLVDILNQYDEEITTTRSYSNDNFKIVFGFTIWDGFVIYVHDFNSFTKIRISHSEIADVLQTLIAWLDKTIKWSNEIEESVL